MTDGRSAAEAPPRPATRGLDLLPAIALVAGLPALVVVYIAMWIDAFDTLRMHDYGREYYNLTRWLAGGELYSTDGALINFVPPVVHLLYLPFALLPPLPSYIAWLAVNVALLVWVWGRVLDDLGLPVRRVAPLTMVVFSSAPLLTGAYTGQPIGFLAWLGWTVADTLRSGGRARGGVALGLLTAWKPTFGLVAAAVFVAGHVRMTIVAAASTIGLTGLGVLVFGMRTATAWYEQMGLVAVYPSRMNVSVYGFFYRALRGGFNFAPIVSAPDLVPVLSVLAAVPIVGLSVRALRRARHGDTIFTIAVTSASLLFPIGWTYYLPAVIPSFVRDAAARGLPRISIAAAALMLIPFPLTWLGQPSPVATMTIGSIYAWSMLLLLYGSTAGADVDR